MAGRAERLEFAPGWDQTLRALGMHSGAWVFDDARVIPWRTLKERDNAVLDTPAGRLHVKRHAATSRPTPAAIEVDGLQLLHAANIPTLDLVAWGELPDGRSFSMTRDLQGYASAQELLRTGSTFASVADATARIAGQLHTAGLHHRDLYLCHFFIKDDDCRLIDVGRVRRIPWLMGHRWVVKDLAQFWYSAAGEFAVPDTELHAWLATYAQHRGINANTWTPSIRRKAAAIAHHDARLKIAQPNRDVSLKTR